MAISSSLKKILDRKQWEMCTPCPLASSAGAFITSSTLHDQYQFWMSVLATPFMYDPKEDSWIALPASGLGGATGAGMCGTFVPNGPTGTATAGTTTTLTTNLTIPGSLAGYSIRITGGPGAGDERVILSNTIGANSVITVTSAFSATITASSTYVIMSGRWYAFVGTTTSSMKYYDVATNTWSAALTMTNVPASFTTDAKLRSTPGGTRFSQGLATAGAATTLTDSTRSWETNKWAAMLIRITAGTGAGQARVIVSNTSTVITVDSAWSVNPSTDSTYVIECFAAGTATAGASTTLTNSGKAWTTNQWANYQVRIFAGTGAGQVRTISSNTGTVLTVSSAWGTNPDATSKYVIEGNDDYIYLAGNNAVTMYRYSVSGNAWTILSPGVARGSAPGLGMSLQWISTVEDPAWIAENTNLNGRYLYSFRGAATSTLSRYDIAANSWSDITYQRAMETFTTGTSWNNAGDGQIYCQKDATSRFFKFDVVSNELTAWSFLPYAQSTAVAGDRLFDASYISGSDKVTWIYHVRNTGTEMFRCLVF